jgi:hypothetical protein
MSPPEYLPGATESAGSGTSSRVSRQVISAAGDTADEYTSRLATSPGLALERRPQHRSSPTIRRDGRHKAAFFVSFGFTAERWEDLAAALLQHAADHEISKEEDSPFGQRFVIEGIMETPDGRTPGVRSVWFIDSGRDTPRFVTAYPVRRQDDD